MENQGCCGMVCHQLEEKKKQVRSGLLVLPHYSDTTKVQKHNVIVLGKFYYLVLKAGEWNVS